MFNIKVNGIVSSISKVENVKWNDGVKEVYGNSFHLQFITISDSGVPVINKVKIKDFSGDLEKFRNDFVNKKIEIDDVYFMSMNDRKDVYLSCELKNIKKVD